MDCITALVGVSGTNAAFDIAYSYIVPPELEGEVSVGKRVIVPFGRGNRRRTGIVVGMEVSDGKGCKEISSVIDSEPVIGEEQLELLMWLKDTVFCTYFEAFRALIPPGLGVNFVSKYRLGAKKPKKDQVSDKALGLYMSAAEAEDGDELDMILSSDLTLANELVSGGFVEETDIAKQRVKDDTVSMVRLTDAYAQGSIKLTPKQTAAAQILEREGCASVKELCYMCGCTAQVVKNMVKCGAAELFDYEVLKTPEAVQRDDISKITLNHYQQAAFEGISQMIAEKKPVAALLFGVTGSGKTPVFAKLIEYTLNMGRNVIMLIPEISLTPQTLNRFRGLFGETVAVMHSGLSLSMRSNEYKRVKSGQCRIVVGTRSAVFAPLDNIGLIIVDEEGERTYKSESSPRYNAKDAAARRCLYHKSVLLCASATPSIESYYNALRGRSKLFVMPERYCADPYRKPEMPRAEIVDMTGTRGIARHVAHRDAAALCGGEVDDVVARRKDTHELQVRAGGKNFVRQADLVDKNDLRIANAGGSVLLRGAVIDRQLTEGGKFIPAQVAGIGGIGIENDNFHDSRPPIFARGMTADKRIPCNGRDRENDLQNIAHQRIHRRDEYDKRRERAAQQERGADDDQARQDVVDEAVRVEAVVLRAPAGIEQLVIKQDAVPSEAEDGVEQVERHGGQQHDHEPVEDVGQLGQVGAVRAALRSVRGIGGGFKQACEHMGSPPMFRYHDYSKSGRAMQL